MITTARILLILFALLPFLAHAQDGVPYLVFKDSQSPNGRYAVAWGVPYETLDPADPDLLNQVSDTVENYLVDLKKEQIMATLPSTYFETGDASKNHADLSACWRDDSLAVMVVEESRWGYDHVSVVYVLDPDKEWDQCSDAIPVAQSLNRLFHSVLKQRHPDKLEEIDDLIFSIRPQSWKGKETIQMEATGQLPKQDDSIGFNEVIAVNLPGPQLVSLSGAEENPDTEAGGSSSGRLITPNSVGPVEIGMTVAEARQVLPGTKFSRTFNGEGIALIQVEKNDDSLMHFFAGEWEADAAINESGVIELINVWSPAYQTKEGAHVKMTMEEMEGLYGSVEEIMMSEIEGREHAAFDGVSSGYSFQLSHAEDTAGLYAGKERTTDRFRPGAFLDSLEVRGPAIMIEGRIGGITLSETPDKVWAAAGKGSWGKADQGKDEIWEAFGQAVQRWRFPSAGIELNMISDEVGGSKSVFSISVEAPFSLRTGRGVGIGSSRAEVESAYQDFPPDPEGFEGYFEDQDVHLVGSIYGGMLFTFEKDRVVKIFLGALAE